MEGDIELYVYVRTSEYYVMIEMGVLNLYRKILGAVYYKTGSTTIPWYIVFTFETAMLKRARNAPKKANYKILDIITQSN